MGASPQAAQTERTNTEPVTTSDDESHFEAKISLAGVDARRRQTRRPDLVDHEVRDPAAGEPGARGVHQLALQAVPGLGRDAISPVLDALDLARIVGREQGFLIGVRVMSGTISARQAGAAYAGLAETLIEVLSDRVTDELVLQYGHMPGGETAIVAMGKLGGNEMSAASDLDLITVLDRGGFGLRPMGSCGLGRFRPTLEGGPEVILEDEPEG